PSRLDQRHGRPTPGTAGEEQLGFGGAALTSSMAAQIKVCSPFRLLRARSLWIVGFVLSLTSALLPASASPRGLADGFARSAGAHESLDSANPAEVKSQESSSKPQEQESSSRQ